jgi:hypothetical protein
LWAGAARERDGDQPRPAHRAGGLSSAPDQVPER